MKLPLKKIENLQNQLEEHPLLNGEIINDIDGIRLFMEHHVFAVWDFMSLIKSLQHHICPSTTCWVPRQKIRSGSARMINEIVLAEETDIDIDGVSSISHHDLYCQAMLEIGADAKLIEEWVESVEINGFHGAKEYCSVPTASLEFMEKTFSFIDSGEPHVIAAAFCFGRETIIPKMFTRLLEKLQLSEFDCPKLYYYLSRHIELDGDSHGPASILLVEDLCDHDPVHIHEAEQAALIALKARIKLWDDVANLITNQSHLYTHD
jgi:hypothetical protein